MVSRIQIINYGESGTVMAGESILETAKRQGSAQVQVTEGPSPGLSMATGTRVTGIGVQQPPETVYPATNV